MDEGESKLDSPISFQICFDSIFSTTSINYRNKSLTVLDFDIQMMSDKNKCVKRGEFISHWKCFLTHINLQIQPILLYNLMPCYWNNISMCKVTQERPLPAMTCNSSFCCMNQWILLLGRLLDLSMTSRGKNEYFIYIFSSLDAA